MMWMVLTLALIQTQMFDAMPRPQVHYCTDKICHPDYTLYPNMGAALVGYDPSLADPFSSSDPGLRQQIFSPTVPVEGTTTYKTATFISAKDVSSCQAKMTITSVRDFKSYEDVHTNSYSYSQTDTETEVNNFLFWKDEEHKSTTTSTNSRSAEIKKFWKDTQGEVILGQASCVTQRFEISSVGPYVFTDGFIRQLQALHTAAENPDSAQAKNSFATFVGDFGLYYLSKVDMGAKLIYESIFTKKEVKMVDIKKRLECFVDAVSSGESSGFKIEDIKLNLEHGTEAKLELSEGPELGVSNKIGLETTIPGVEFSDTATFANKSTKCHEDSKSKSHFTSNSLTSTTIYTVGSHPTTLDKWVTQEFDAPQPIRLELTDISELFNPANSAVLRDVGSIESSKGSGVMLNVRAIHAFFKRMRDGCFKDSKSYTRSRCKVHDQRLQSIKREEKKEKDEDTMKRLRDDFAQFGDGDDQLSREEVGKIMGKKLADKCLDGIFKSVDTDEDGVVTWGEFKRVTRGKPSLKRFKEEFKKDIKECNKEIETADKLVKRMVEGVEFIEDVMVAVKDKTRELERLVKETDGKLAHLTKAIGAASAKSIEIYREAIYKYLSVKDNIRRERDNLKSLAMTTVSKCGDIKLFMQAWDSNTSVHEQKQYVDEQLRGMKEILEQSKTDLTDAKKVYDDSIRELEEVDTKLQQFQEGMQTMLEWNKEEYNEWNQKVRSGNYLDMVIEISGKTSNIISRDGKGKPWYFQAGVLLASTITTVVITETQIARVRKNINKLEIAVESSVHDVTVARVGINGLHNFIESELELIVEWTAAVENMQKWVLTTEGDDFYRLPHLRRQFTDAVNQLTNAAKAFSDQPDLFIGALDNEISEEF